jgi:hypothetical protein
LLPRTADNRKDLRLQADIWAADFLATGPDSIANLRIRHPANEPTAAAPSDERYPFAVNDVT